MQTIAYHTYGSPEVLKLEEAETPTPGDEEVRIRIHAAVVSAADSAFRQGDPLFARLFTGLTRPKNPILGTEFSGVIDAVGKNVRRFEVGDQVFAASGASLGAHAEYICLSEDGALSLKPKNVTHEEAAALCEGTLTALPFLRDKGAIQSGQQVLINGASGSVGTSAVQLAKHFGAEVTGVCSTRNLDLVRSLGAAQVVDYTNADFTRTGNTYDIIFDAVGKSSFSRCKGSLNPGGIYLKTVLTPAIMLQMMWTANFGRKKARIAFTGLRPDNQKAKDLQFLTGLAESGAVRAVVDRCYPMDQAAAAHELVDSGRKKGSVVISICSS